MPGGDEAGARVYAWERDDEAEEEMKQLREEIAEQEKMLEDHQKAVSGNEAELERMIKELRSELQGFKEDSWKLEQFEELSDMKMRLMMGEIAGGSAGHQGEDGGDEGRPMPGVDVDFAELDKLNSEMDREMETLMSQLGMVKDEMSSLDVKRKALMDELDTFDEETDSSALASLGGDPLSTGGFAQSAIEQLGKTLNKVEE